MRLTTHQSVMGRNRKHDIAYGMGATWLKKIGKYKYELIEEAVDKLGQYEDIDEDPEHLAKVKRAFEIIKEKRVDVGRLLISKNVEEYNDYVFSYYHVGLFGLMQLEYDLLKEVLL